MSRSNPEKMSAKRPKPIGGLQSRLLGQLVERQQASAKGNEVWVEILEDRVSIGGYRLEAVLSSVEERLGSDAKILRTERQIIGGIRGFFGRESFLVEAALPKVTLPEATLPEPDISGSAPTHGPSFAKALAAALAEVETAELALEPTPMADPEFRSGAAFLTLEAEDLSHEALLAQVSDLMQPSVETPLHGIVAVVGDPDECVAAARNLASMAGVDAGEVLVMSPEPVAGQPSWMCVTTIEDCIRRRSRWVDDNRLHIVAVVLNAGPSGMEWACTALDALAPEQTHLAVPGWRRVEDVVARLRSLAPIAAIDLVGATDPATVVGFLDLDVPVSTIDGATATADLWCSYLATNSNPIRLRSGSASRRDPVLTASTGVENLR